MSSEDRAPSRRSTKTPEERLAIARERTRRLEESLLVPPAVRRDLATLNKAAAVCDRYGAGDYASGIRSVADALRAKAITEAGKPAA
jgi:hypothetical protein